MKSSTPYLSRYKIFKLNNQQFKIESWTVSNKNGNWPCTADS